MTDQSIDFSILILAGGRGSRMGGKDKGLIQIDGKSMIQHLLDTLSSFNADILISCNRHLEDYTELGHSVISDGNTNYFGPLAGIASGLKVADKSHVLVLPCDTPAVTKRLVKRLMQAAKENPEHICMAHDGNRPQPLHAAIPVNYLDSLLNTIAANRHSVMEWYAQHPLKTVNCEDLPGDFANANRPEELAVLTAMLKAASSAMSE